jgi:RNA polymerase II-associated factor 1
VKKKKVKRPDLSKALWLMNTQYISSASLPEHLGRSEQAYAKGKAKQGRDGSRRRRRRGMTGAIRAEAQIESIEASFAAAARAPVHPTAPKTTKPLEVIPVLPDFERWAGDHLHFVFDEDPCKGVARTRRRG